MGPENCEVSVCEMVCEVILAFFALGFGGGGSTSKDCTGDSAVASALGLSSGNGGIFFAFCGRRSGGYANCEVVIYGVIDMLPVFRKTLANGALLYVAPVV